MRAVVAVGGWAHPANGRADAWRELLQERFELVDVAADVHALSTALAKTPDLLVVAACWFAMEDERYTADQRAEHAVRLSGDDRAALAAVRSAGCPLLAMHTAPICFDGWPAWVDWLGAVWNWESSWHPPPATMSVRPVVDSPVAFDAFELLDEEYQELELRSDVTLVAESANGHPLAWLNDAAGARTAVDLLGHDPDSLANPGHRRLLDGLLNHLLDESVA